MSTFVPDLRFVLSGLLGGTLVGLTGMGGGAVLTPLLLALGVPAGAAVGSDLVVSLIIKPVAGSVHARARTVRWDLVRWLAAASVPAAFVGALVSQRLTAHGDVALRRAIGCSLLLAASAMVVRAVLRYRRAHGLRGPAAAAPVAAGSPPVRPLPTLLLGVVGGFLVGLTSVGSGSLMVVALLLLYPALQSQELVGTDLVQAVPLVGAAALGHVLLGSFSLGLTTALALGGIPGAYLGARLSTRPATRIVRPALVTILLATGTRLALA